MGEKIWRLLDNYFCGNYLDVNDHSIDYYYTIEGHSWMNVIKRVLDMMHLLEQNVINAWELTNLGPDLKGFLNGTRNQLYECVRAPLTVTHL